jgi:hypothetical protein
MGRKGKKRRMRQRVRIVFVMENICTKEEKQMSAKTAA